MMRALPALYGSYAHAMLTRLIREGLNAVFYCILVFLTETSHTNKEKHIFLNAEYEYLFPVACVSCFCSKHQ